MTDREWNAGAYHEVSTPQQAWGRKVLARLELRGDETVLDAGCGSGHLTADLLERLPNGRVVALDNSANMLAEARKNLARFGDRVTFVRGDLGALELRAVADVVFSAATFHWVANHDALFRGLFAALRPGGRLCAQCGGEGNLARHYGRVHAFLGRPDVAPLFVGFEQPTNFQGPPATATRLDAAGFRHAKVWLEDAPTIFADEAAYRRFVATVTIRHELERLGTDERRGELLDALALAAKNDDPPFCLDYVRLNLDAEKP